MLKRQSYISNLPVEKIQKCVIAGQAEVVDSLLKRVVLLDRATMQLLAARNVDDDNTWEIFSRDLGDGKHLLIGLDEGGNFNIDGADRVSMGPRTFTADSENYEEKIASATAYYVSRGVVLDFDTLDDIKLPGEQDGLKFNTAFGSVSPFKDGYPADFQCDWKAIIGETEVQPVFYSIDPSKVSETVENFRIGIDLSLVPEIFNVITGVGDISIIFETGDFLDFEIESFDAGLKKGLIWAVLPYISADAITYWALVYSLSESQNSGPDGSVANNVWDDYLFVHHMAEDPVGTDACIDSVGENHGTPENMALANRSFGPLSGYEYEFNGVDETINLGNLCPEGLMEGTIEVVFKTTDTKGHILSQDADGWNDRDANLSIGDPTGVVSTVTAGHLNFEAQGPVVSEVKNVTSTVAVNDNQYHYAAASWYRDNFGLVLDDVIDVPQIEYKMWEASTDVKIGTDGTSFFNGSINEILISDEYKSLEYCKLLNKSLNDSLLTYNTGTGVWLAGWAFRISFTIDSTKIDSDLSDYPIAVNFSASAGLSNQDLTDIFSNMTYADRKKVLFTLSDNTRCVAECECWDDVNQFATYHVRVPIVSTTSNDTLYAYFDPTADDQNTRNIVDASDDFTGNVLNTEVWSFYSGSDAIVQNNKLAITDTILSSRFVLPNSFSLQIDFDGTGMVTDGHKIGISVYDRGVPGGVTGAYILYRKSSGNLVYQTNAVVSGSWDTTVEDSDPAESGTFKIDYNAVSSQINIYTQKGLLATYTLSDPYKPTIELISAGAYYLSDFTINSADSISGFTDDTGTVTAQTAWPSNYVGVWHMAQDPSQGGACILDSTSNANHGTPSGSMTSDDLVDGLVGKGLSFDGVDNYVEIPHSNSLNVDDLTLEIILKSNNTTIITGNRSVLYKWGRTLPDDPGFLIYERRETLETRMGSFDNFEAQISLNILGARDGSYKYLAGTFDFDASQKGFIDGTVQVTDYKSSDSINNTENIFIGADESLGSGIFFDGEISEVRISNDAIPDARIKANNYALRDDLLSFGEIEVPITFNADESIQNLPIKLTLSAISGINSVDMRSRVISQSGNVLIRHNNTPVKAEVAYWDVGIKGIIWALLPEVLSGVNTLTIDDAGEAVVTTGTIASTVGQEVWSDFKAVYHLCQDPAVIKDSTGNNSDATPVNMDASNLVDEDTVFNGTDESINLGTIFDGIQDAGQVHIGFKTSQSEAPILMQNDEGVYVTTGKVKIDSGSNDESLTALNDDAFHAVSYQFDHHKRDLLVDGVDQIPYEIFGSTGTADLIVAGNYLGASFEGNIPELRFNQKSEYQHKLLLQGKLWNQALADIPNDPLIIPTISFDEGSTYNIWNGSAWRAIVSNDDAVHGDAGDTDWHYVDAGTTWAKTVENTFDAALTAAIQYPENRNHAETLSALDSSQWTSTGGMGADGNFTLAFCYNQNITGLTAEIESVSADGMLLVTVPIDLEPYDRIITGSKIEWSIKIVDSDYDYSQVEVYSHITGGTWQLCTRNDVIPSITSTMAATGMILDFKIKAPLDLPEGSTIILYPKIF